MVAWDRGYYGATFKGFCRVTQGDPLSPTIFNVVVDAFLRHWFTIVMKLDEAVLPGASNIERSGRNVHYLAAYFYIDNGLLASTQATCLQRDFDILT